MARDPLVDIWWFSPVYCRQPESHQTHSGDVSSRTLWTRGSCSWPEEMHAWRSLGPKLTNVNKTLMKLVPSTAQCTWVYNSDNPYFFKTSLMIKKWEYRPWYYYRAIVSRKYCAEYRPWCYMAQLVKVWRCFPSIICIQSESNKATSTLGKFLWIVTVHNFVMSL